MSYAPDDDLSRALARLTVQDVWRRAGLPDCPRDGNIVVPCPWRENRKSPSFSICHRGKGWKDWGNADAGWTEGGVWQFAAKVTGLGGKELADQLIEWAGIVRTPRFRDAATRAAAKAGTGKMEDVVAELPPELRRAVKRQEQARELREAEGRLHEEMERARAPKMAARNVPAWTPVVRARYLEGWREMGREPRRAEWAEARGWPVAWVDWLVQEGLVAMPWLPWAEPGEPRAKRGKAFRVDMPTWDDAGDFRGLRQVGYHQQFWTEHGKAWAYTPSMPSAERRRSVFLREMVEAELARGVREDAGDALVPGLPFVVPGTLPARLLVLAEGQWDAITLAGAAGWLESDTAWPDGVWLFGLRGSSGLDPFLAWWRPLLVAARPAVLVLADNDAAGMRWSQPGPPKVLGGPRPPSLGEKLRAAGASRVEIARVRPEHGKDFNDYFRARRPSALDIARWFAALRIFPRA